MRRVALVLVVLLVAGCLRPVAEAPRLARPFQVETIDGETFRLRDHRGEVVLLDFMATWCIPCRTQIPEFAAVHARHTEDLAVLSVDVDPTEDADDLRRFRDEVGVGWPFALDTEALRVHYGAVALPKQVLVDPDGFVAWETRPGQVVDGARLEREVERVLRNADGR